MERGERLEWDRERSREAESGERLEWDRSAERGKQEDRPSSDSLSN